VGGNEWQGVIWSAGSEGGKGPKTVRGCIAASPNRRNKIFRFTYLFFFFAFFFAAILFSSQLLELSRQRCWRSAYSFTMYSETELSCQEKSEFMSQEIGAVRYRTQAPLTCGEGQ
jgi:hypothetical protein